MDNIIHK